MFEDISFKQLFLSRLTDSFSSASVAEEST